MTHYDMRCSIHTRNEIDHARKQRFEELAESLGLTASQLLARLVKNLPTCVQLMRQEAVRDMGDYDHGRRVELEILIGEKLHDLAALDAVKP